MSRTSRRHFLQTAATSATSLAAWDHHSAQAEPHKPEHLGDLAAYVERAMAKWEVPGLAVAVVKDGKLILARGFGVRGLGATAAVDSETVFPIASCTKA